MADFIVDKVWTIRPSEPKWRGPHCPKRTLEPENFYGQQRTRRRQPPYRCRQEALPAKGQADGQTVWTKRDKIDGKFMAVKKGKNKFKGIRREKKAA
jgi:hypothetical protein